MEGSSVAGKLLESTTPLDTPDPLAGLDLSRVETHLTIKRRLHPDWPEEKVRAVVEAERAYDRTAQWDCNDVLPREERGDTEAAEKQHRCPAEDGAPSPESE